MVALIVIGSIVLFLLLLLLCPAKVIVRMMGDDLSVKLRYGFLTIKILPTKEKSEEQLRKIEEKKKQKQREKKKKKEEAKAEKKRKKEAGEELPPSFIQKMKDQHGIRGLLSLAKGLIKIATGTVWNIAKHIVVYKLHLNIRVAGSDAAATAIQYGQISAAMEPCLAILLPAVPKQLRKDVWWNIEPDFVAESMSVQVDVRVGIRPIFIFSAVFGALFKLIRTFLAANKKAKGRQNIKK